MKTYAQVSGGICVAITQAAAKPTAVNGDVMVELQAYDTSYLGRAYANGAWA